MGDAAQLRRRQGDGFQGGLRVHPLSSGQGSAQGQILNGQLRVVSANGHRHTRLHQPSGVGHPLMRQLRLGTVTDDGPHDGSGTLPCQDVRHQIPFRGVDQHVVQMVSVEVNGELPLYHRHQGFQHGIVVGRVLVFRVRLVLGHPFCVLQRLAQLLPHEGGGGHPGGGGFVAAAVGLFGVLPQGELHGRRLQHHHVVHPAPHRLDGGDLPADGVGTAGTGQDGGNTGLPCLLEAVVQRVEGVDDPKLWGAGVRDLVAVVLIVAQPVRQQPQMTVDVHEARQHIPALGIHVLTGYGGGAAAHVPHLGDDAVLPGHEALGDLGPVHGTDHCVVNHHNGFLLLPHPRQDATKLELDNHWKIEYPKGTAHPNRKQGSGQPAPERS